MKTLNFEVYGVPYTAKQKVASPNCIKSNTWVIPNIWGLNGIEALKRANPYGDPCGEINIHSYGENIDYLCLVTVEPSSIILTLAPGKASLDAILYIVERIETAYASVGWEFLEQ